MVVFTNLNKDGCRRLRQRTRAVTAGEQTAEKFRLCQGRNRWHCSHSMKLRRL